MQLSYTLNAPEAVLGMMSEDFTKYVDTVIPQVAVRTGTLVCADLTTGKVRNAAKLPGTGAETGRPTAMGIVPADLMRDISVAVAANTPDWPAMRPAPAMRRGRIWVLAESAVTRWSYPFVRFAAGAGGTVIGGFRADADSASAAQLTTAIFLTEADAGGLALLEIDLF
jgi:hypothetical protein